MRRFVVLALALSVVATIPFFPQAAGAAVVTNLISDSSFEDYLNPTSPWTYGGNAGWSCDISRTGAMSGDIGGSRGEPGPSGNILQSFLLPSPIGDLEFGAYFRITTSSIAGNWDQAQINLQILANNATIGGSISNLPVTWTQFTDYEGATAYRSDWFLVSGVVDASLFGGDLATINISLQDYSGAVTQMYVDDVFAGAAAPVPEPGTMMLLGSGLLGLAGYGRKRMRK